MSSRVYFTRVADGESPEALALKGAKLYEEAGFAAQLEKGKLVGIKQHFGEKGGNGYLHPPIAKQFVELVKATGAKPFLTDTSTLYKGSRSTAVDYLNRCYEHGFSHETMGCPIIMADGLIGASQMFVEVNGKHYPRVPIASDAFHAFGFVVLTHVTGHMCGGMGASIKNVAMGLSSRAGKLDQHHGDVPIVNAETCTACATCEGLCPADAIAVGDVAVIDAEKCIGCGECMTVCPEDAIGFKWGETNSRLNEKMVEHALAVKKTHEGRMCYFNFMTHITKDCDCLGVVQEPGCDDIGIVASSDMVAVDQATADIMQRELGKDIFKEFNPALEYVSQMTYGESMGLGSREYELIEIE